MLEPFYAALKDYAKDNGAIELVIKPYDTYQTFDSDGNPTSEEQTHFMDTLKNLGYQHDGLTTGYPGGEGDWHYVKDMEGITEKNLLQSFSKKGKPLVKKAKSFGIELKRLNRDELQLFKDITSSTSDRRDYQDKTLDYYQTFYDSFGDKADFMIATLNFHHYYTNLEKDQAKLAQKIEKLQKDLEVNPNSEKKQNQLREFSSQFDTFEVRKKEAKEYIEKYGDQDVILAGSLFVYMPQESTYLFSGSYTEFNKFYAPAVLQEYMILETIKRGIPRYNFLGIQGIFDGSDGVLRFKQNFNGYIVRKMGTFRYYPRPLKYKMISLIKKLLGRS
jgi:peptidoglycan branched peptide synthesis protein, alanine adding enzyme